MNMKSFLMILLVLAMLAGTAAAAEITATIPAAPAGGFPAGEAVTIPIQITGAQGLSYWRVDYAVTDGTVSFRQGDIGQIKTNDELGRVVWEGYYDENGYVQSGYTNEGTATLFYADVTPENSDCTVTLTFREIWKANLDNQIPLYFNNGGTLVLTLTGSPAVEPEIIDVAPGTGTFTYTTNHPDYVETVDVDKMTAFGVLYASDLPFVSGYRWGGIYIDSIEGKAPATPYEGWMYQVNGESPSPMANECPVEIGDIVVWYYSASMDDTPATSPKAYYFRVIESDDEPSVLPEIDGKISWGDFTFVDGSASIPVIMTGAADLTGITVTLSNTGGADIALSATGADLSYFRESATRLMFMPADPYTNADDVTLFYVNIDNAAPGSEVSFDLSFSIKSSPAIDVTGEYIAPNPVTVTFTVPADDPSSTVTVTYDGVIDGAYVPRAATVPVGSMYTVTSERAIVAGYVFVGWTLNDVIVSAPFAVNSNTVLFAQWFELNADFTPTMDDLEAFADLLMEEEVGYNENYDLNNDEVLDFYELILLAQYVADHMVI